MPVARWKNLPFGGWIRTCQDCDHRQVDLTPPHERGNNAFCNKKCRSCGSQSLDYGQSNEVDDEECDN